MCQLNFGHRIKDHDFLIKNLQIKIGHHIDEGVPSWY
jgi:hypothetical protein